MRIYKLDLIYYLPIFPLSSHPTFVCFCPVGLSLLIQHFQQVLRVLKFLLSPGLGSWQLEFKSLIIVIVGFQNFVCYLAWAGDLDNHRKINTLEEIEILKAASSGNLLNVIAGQNDPIYKLFPSSVILTSR